MKHSVPLCCSYLFFRAFAGDQKPLPNQAGNDDIDLQGTAADDSRRHPASAGRQRPGCAVGHMIVVRMKVTPKSAKPLRISPDDFTLLSRKDGERSPALSPNQMAGGGTVLVVKPAAKQPGGDGTTVNGPIWGGVAMGRKPANSNSDTSVSTSTAQEDSPLLKVLTEKSLPDKDIKAPVEGLLYFAIDGKLKPKDLSLIYQGQGGKLVVDFK